jgi:hypothetical protein
LAEGIANSIFANLIGGSILTVLLANPAPLIVTGMGAVILSIVAWNGPGFAASLLSGSSTISAGQAMQGVMGMVQGAMMATSGMHSMSDKHSLQSQHDKETQVQGGAGGAGGNGAIGSNASNGEGLGGSNYDQNALLNANGAAGSSNGSLPGAGAGAATPVGGSTGGSSDSMGIDRNTGNVRQSLEAQRASNRSAQQTQQSFGFV